jgi:hypothetical protein
VEDEELDYDLDLEYYANDDIWTHKQTN